MKKAAVWVAVLSGVIADIAMLAMGIGVYHMDEDLICITAYIVLSCLAILYITALVFRFSPSNCPHCGRYVPSNAVYCPYCGEEIHREVK